LIETTGLHHVRLTVTDLERSRAFYSDVLRFEVAAESPGSPEDPEVRADPAQLYGGVAFQTNGMLFGLRPVADTGDQFLAERVGLDHLSFIRAIGRALQSRGLTVVRWTNNEEHTRATEADGLMVYKSNPTRDATENPPPISTGSTMGSPSETMTPSTRWSRSTSPSTSDAVTYFANTFPRGRKSPRIRNIWRWWLAISTTDPVRSITGKSPPRYSPNVSNQMLRPPEFAEY
jgi:catechol 2,3-dioxygenase-like lactoylglutathione lyase family enzyme